VTIVASVEEPVVVGKASWRTDKDLHVAVVSVVRVVANFAVITAVLIGLWQGAISLFHLSPIVAKTPADVFDFLLSGPSAQTNRAAILSALGTTLEQAGLGYLAGTGAAVGLAVVCVVARPLAYVTMPVSLVLQSVPLSALTPVLLLMFGRGLVTTTIVSGIVAFFPSFVNVLVALQRTSMSLVDLCLANGASATTVLRKVRLPAALPSVCAAAKIAVPLSLIGSLLAEWIATGNGLGYLMLEDRVSFEYVQLWAAVVVSTLVMVLAFSLVSGVERIALIRYAPDRVAAR